METTYKCDHFASQLAEINPNFDTIPLKIYIRPPVTLWRTLMSAHHFVQSRAAFPPLVLVFPFTPKAVCRIYADHIQHWAVDVHELLFETIGEIRQINTRPVIIEIIWFSGRGLYQRGVWIITGDSQSDISKVTLIWIIYVNYTYQIGEWQWHYP